VAKEKYLPWAVVIGDFLLLILATILKEKKTNFRLPPS
jgi:hypothetical protein